MDKITTTTDRPNAERPPDPPPTTDKFGVDGVAERALDEWCAEHRPAERRKPIGKRGKMTA